MNLDVFTRRLDELKAAALKLQAEWGAEGEKKLQEFKATAKEKLLDIVLELTREK